MNTQQIENVFENYLLTNHVQYAILLNGGWGSGKTYFWKYTLCKIAADKKFKTIYISLNGISKIEALEQQLSFNLIPYLSNVENKTAKGVGKVLANAVDVWFKSESKSNLKDLLKGITLSSYDFNNHIICFDDLERCQIPLKEVLGFINKYIEHDNAKVIILADETNLDANQKYDNIKEKIIGRILNFEPKIDDIVPLSFEHYKNKNDFYTFLCDHKTEIIKIFTEYKQNNIRTIAFYISILDKIFPALLDVQASYVQEIIYFAAVITIEFKKGNLKSDDSKNSIVIKDIRSYSMIYSRNRHLATKKTNEDTDIAKSPQDIFYETYCQNKNYFFYKLIYSYIISGYFDIEAFKKEIQQRYPEVVPPEIQDLRTILNYKFRELSDYDFAESANNVLNYVKEGKYFIYEYAQIAHFFYFFSDNQLINLSVASIKQYLLAGLEIAKQRKQIHDYSLTNMLFFEDKNPTVTEIKHIIRDIHNEIKKEQYQQISDEFITGINNKDEQDLADFMRKNIISSKLFKYIEINVFVEAIINLSNKKLSSFTNLIGNTYDISNAGEFLFEDSVLLLQTVDKLNEYIKANKEVQPLRFFLLNKFISELIKICKHLEASKKI
jgi:hypothetical protein